MLPLRGRRAAGQRAKQRVDEHTELRVDLLGQDRAPARSGGSAPFWPGTTGKSAQLLLDDAAEPLHAVVAEVLRRGGVSRNDAAVATSRPVPRGPVRSRRCGRGTGRRPRRRTPSRLKTIFLPSCRACAVSSRNLRMRRPAGLGGVELLQDRPPPARSRSACLIRFSSSSIRFASLASSRPKSTSPSCRPGRRGSLVVLLACSASAAGRASTCDIRARCRRRAPCGAAVLRRGCRSTASP